MTADIALYADDIGEVTETSWKGRADMTFEEWLQVGRTMQQIGRSLSWWLGDLLVFGEHKYGETYAQVVEATNLSVETIKKYKAVSERVQPEVRRPLLSWSMHFAVAYLPAGEHDDLLAIAERFELSTREFKDIVNLQVEERVAIVDVCRRNPQLGGKELWQAIQGQKMLRLAESAEESTSLQRTEPNTKRNSEDKSDEVFMGDELDCTDLDMVENFWSSHGNPVQLRANMATWKGVSVKAVMHNGEPQLQWEVRV